MSKATSSSHKVPAPEAVDEEVLQFRDQFDEKSPLDELVRRGAQQMLQAAVEAEVDQFLLEHSSKTDDEGRRYVVRNGRLPERKILTGAGQLEIQQPRVRDNSPNPSARARFSPSIIPQYMRRSPSLEEMLPVLYLLGVSTGDFSEAFEALLGADAGGLSANTIVRLKEAWTNEYQTWSQRDLSDKHYVYVWADGVHVNVRLEDPENQRQCFLVLMGATKDGRKELIAIQDGYRESKENWRELLLNVKQRGLAIDPELAIGDGALGFWAALREVFPKTKEQRCWFHKSGNVLKEMPKSVQKRAKPALQSIWQAETREQAMKAYDDFREKYEAKYPKAWLCLSKDEDVLFTFYDFPAEHWRHIRTTNPIESVFATIRLRHRRTKGSGSRRTSLAMMFKLATHAEKRWRRLNGHQMIIPLLEGKKFTDGIMQQENAA